MRSVPDDAVILEIGGGYGPRFVRPRNPNVFHLDHCSAEELRAKYAADPTVAHLVDRIQPIDFVCAGTPIDSVVPADLKFDVIYGSHTLEHQVDMIGHLQSLERLLKPGGRVILMIPDLRTCFDALRYPTVTADALAAHQRKGQIHQGRQVFDSVSREIDKNQGYRMCNADLDDVRFRHDLKTARDAMTVAEVAGQRYVDLHAWTFTPESFRLLLVELRLLELTHLEPHLVSDTYGNQFCAVLQPVPGAAVQLSPLTRGGLERERLALSKALRMR